MDTVNETKKKRKIKPWNELTITDDFMFCKVMQNEKICRKMISLLLGIEPGRIEQISYQETIDPGKQKGVRLDVLVRDGDGRVIDLEMQMTDQHNLQRRGRYYLSAIDVSDIGLLSGEEYSKLPECYIVFICPFDYLKKGLPVYTMRTVCLETGEVYEDGVTKLLVNSAAADREDNPDLKGFLDLMNSKDTDNSFAAEIREEIAQIKTNAEWRTEYMVLKAREMELREEGREEGRKEGRAEGRAEGRIDLLLSLVKDGVLSVVDAAMRAGISPDEFSKKLQKN